MVETYSPVHGGTKEIAFDPELMLPPDAPSEWVGNNSISAVQWQRYLLQEPERQTRLLIPGVGCGIIACAYLAQVERLQDNPFANGPLHIDALDINPEALEIAETNIQKYADGLPGVTYDLHEVDWNDDGWWSEMGPDRFDAIALNPPYLPEGMTVLERYTNAPSVALYSGRDGLDAYRQLVPRFAASLSRERGASIVGRYSSSGTGDDLIDIQTRKLRYILTSYFDVESDEASLRMLPAEGPCKDDRWMSSFIYQREVPRYPGAPFGDRRGRLGQVTHIDGLNRLARASIEFADVLRGTIMPEQVGIDLRNMTHGYRLDHEARAMVVCGLFKYGSLLEMTPDVLEEFKQSIGGEAAGYADEALESHAKWFAKKD